MNYEFTPELWSLKIDDHFALRILLKQPWLIILFFNLSACSPGSNLPQSNAPDEPLIKVPPQMTNTDFKATGNEPSWSLVIDFDNQMHFKSLNHPKELITPVPTPDIAQDAPVERYQAVTEKGELMVSIMSDTCMDNMSGEQFPFSVTVAAKLSNESDYTEFKGCGRYLLDNRLHNIWVLEEMDGQKTEAADFSAGLPTLEFYTGEGRVSGHDGCNRLFGKIINQNGDLKFTAMGSTRMACPNMQKSDQFLKLISDQSFGYEFGPRQLVLKQGEKVVMRLKNVD